MTLKQVETYQGQSTLDIALQEYGSLEALFDLLGDNGLTLESLPETGLELEVYTEKAQRPDVVAFYEDYSTGGERPNTGNLPEELKPSGIGYMGIEFDFIVQ